VLVEKTDRDAAATTLGGADLADNDRASVRKYRAIYDTR
jgi:hypothetical protein